MIMYSTVYKLLGEVRVQAKFDIRVVSFNMKDKPSMLLLFTEKVLCTRYNAIWVSDVCSIDQISKVGR